MPRCPHRNLFFKQHLDAHIHSTHGVNVALLPTPIPHIPSNDITITPPLLQDDLDTLPSFPFPSDDSPSPSSTEDDVEDIINSPNRQNSIHGHSDLDDVELWELLQTRYTLPHTLPSPITLPQGNQRQSQNPSLSPPIDSDNPLQSSLDLMPLDTPKLALGDTLFLQNGIATNNAIWSNQDLSLLRMYKACDDAGAPRYLPDQLFSLLGDEMKQNGFNPTHPSITQRDPFMARMHKKFPTTPPIRINVTSQSVSTVA